MADTQSPNQSIPIPAHSPAVRPLCQRSNRVSTISRGNWSTNSDGRSMLGPSTTRSSASLPSTPYVHQSLSNPRSSLLTSWKIDIMTLTWAIHRCNGVSSPANAAYSADELAYQLINSGASSLFTVLPLLSVAIDAAAKAGIPKERVFILELPDKSTGGAQVPKEFRTVTQLIKEGASLPELEPLKWSKGQGARQTAFLCYSSGTSGLPVRRKHSRSSCKLRDSPANSFHRKV